MAEEQVEKVEVADTGAGDGAAARSAGEASEKKAKPDKPESVGESLRRAKEEIAEKDAAVEKAKEPREATEAKAKEQLDEAKALDKESKADAKSKEVKEPPQGEKPAEKPTAPRAAPESWTKEERAEWDKLPPLAQQAVLRREENSKKGVEELKSRYQEFEDAVAPYRATIKNAGRSEGQVVKALFEWNMELAHPDPARKAAAFKQLAANFKIDLAALAPNAGPQPGVSAVETVPDNISSVVEPLRAQVAATQEELNAIRLREQNQVNAAAQETLANFAKEHPYYEQVRADMFKLIQMDMQASQRGLAPEYLTERGHIDLKKVYDTACRMRTEVWSDIQAKEAEKRVADEKARQQTEAARKAAEVKRAKETSSSVRTSAPGATTNSHAPAPKGESVRDSLRRSLAEVKGK